MQLTTSKKTAFTPTTLITTAMFTITLNTKTFRKLTKSIYIKYSKICTFNLVINLKY